MPKVTVKITGRYIFPHTFAEICSKEFGIPTDTRKYKILKREVDELFYCIVRQKSGKSIEAEEIAYLAESIYDLYAEAYPDIVAECESAQEEYNKVNMIKHIVGVLFSEINTKFEVTVS